MVTTEQVAHFKSKLEAEKKLLETELGTLGQRNPDNASDWLPAKPEGDTFGADKNDNADIIEDMHQNNASMNQLEGRLNLVDRALEKIAAGVYGICEVSGHDIEVERLEANPAARTCIAHMADEATLG
jgi:RNA polymerase-binding transcription factor DksA